MDTNTGNNGAQSSTKPSVPRYVQGTAQALNAELDNVIEFARAAQTGLSRDDAEQVAYALEYMALSAGYCEEEWEAIKRKW